jgi:hypothetical protein
MKNALRVDAPIISALLFFLFSEIIKNSFILTSLKSKCQNSNFMLEFSYIIVNFQKLKKIIQVKALLVNQIHMNVLKNYKKHAPLNMLHAAI